MAKPFQDQVILVTGAASGIGRAAALKLSSLGATLSICDINLPALEALSSECSTPTYTQQVDVSSTSQVNTFITSTITKFGKINHVFNCAGINPTSIPLESTTDEYFDKLVNTNLKGVFLVTRACIPHLVAQKTSTGPGGPSIVNVSSISGLHPSAQQSIYCTTKYGLIGFSKSLALELGPKGIRVNCVAPGYIDTPTNAGIVKGGEYVERMRMGNALERLGTGEDVADVVAFLMGEGARYVNGSVVEIDGGLKR